MSTAKMQPRVWGKYVTTLIVALGFTGGVILLLLWLAGLFSPKVPTTVSSSGETFSAKTGSVVAARLLHVPREESAVGSIRAVHETTVGSKLMARVISVDLKAGQEVQKDDVLVQLDDTDLKAKLQQAQAAVTAAEAAHEQAERDDRRFAQLLQSKAASRQDREKAATALKASEAELRRAKEMVNEVAVNLEWATVRSPMDGTVVDKKINAGDLVLPGQSLVTLFDPRKMQLVASVRESLTRRLKVGEMVRVQIQELNKECMGTISEIVPEAQTSSRSFQIKVTGPCPTGIYSGMFGRVLIPLDEEDVLVIPSDAVRTVGQLNLVDVVEEGKVHRRAIRLGRVFDDEVEILSGLSAGEEVVIPAQEAGTTQEPEAHHE